MIMCPSTPVQIINEIANEKGVEPGNIELQLQHYIPTDAIRHLVNHENNAWKLQFETPDYVVEITSDDVILTNVSKKDGTTGNN
jgi:hypothetical protein